MNKISAVIGHTVEATEQIKQASCDLAQLAAERLTHVEYFKIR